MSARFSTREGAPMTETPAPVLPAATFQRRLLEWFDVHGRHDLPWQQERTPYRVWVSEIMLQQTQVATVIPYFARFMARFPDVRALAEAEQDEVLHLWTGLGYYARGRNLHKAAQAIVAEHGGELPAEVGALAALPGIGRSTAGAIVAQSQGHRAVILDGNVKRSLSRLHAVEGWPGRPAVERRLWALAEHYTPHERLPDYTQAMMDLGATLCRRGAPEWAAAPLPMSAWPMPGARSGASPSRSRRRRCPPAPPACCCCATARAGCCSSSVRPAGSGAGSGACPSSTTRRHSRPGSTCMRRRAVWKRLGPPLSMSSATSGWRSPPSRHASSDSMRWARPVAGTIRSVPMPSGWRLRSRRCWPAWRPLPWIPRRPPNPFQLQEENDP